MDDREIKLMYLLGHVHGSLLKIVISNDNNDDKVAQMVALESELRTTIDKLFYSTAPL